MKKNNLILIAIISFILTISVGYALYGETINVNGTATGQGSFDMAFTSAKINSEVGSVGALTNIATDGKTLTITVPKLEFPGAYALFDVEVTNKGTIPSVLKSINKNNFDGDANVKISYENLDKAVGVETNQNDVQRFEIKVMWDASSTAKSSNVEFSLTLNYEQYIY